MSGFGLAKLGLFLVFYAVMLTALFLVHDDDKDDDEKCT